MENKLTDTWIELCASFLEECGVKLKLPYYLRNDVSFTAPTLLVVLRKYQAARAKIAELEARIAALEGNDEMA